jgi:DNA repair protein RecO (recombination protein O)
MPTYTVNAINVGSFLLGESDKVITVFTAERGIIRAVAKGARKPGTKMSGRSDVLCANKLFLSSGKTFEIITQAECIDTFPEFRSDLTRMSYALYYAELTQQLGQGLSEESQWYFDYLLRGLQLQARCRFDPAWLCLEFEMGLLEMLGYRPELTYCVTCRQVLGDYNLGSFNPEQGGVVCQSCSLSHRRSEVAEGAHHQPMVRETSWRQGSHITPLVWKNLVLAADRRVSEESDLERASLVKAPLPQSIQAARRLIQGYIEHRIGRRLKALDLLDQLNVQ